ncbi:MAG: hypothetical protein AAF799_42850 [Myxococcota bacterium]
MSERPFFVELVAPYRLQVQLSGEIDENVVRRLTEDLVPQLRTLGDRGEILFDLCELRACPTSARAGLIELQRAVAKVGARTAFIANRPRFRGIALYVAHKSGDPNARAFHQHTQARAWLRSDEGRVEALTSFLGRAKLPRLRRRSSQSQKLRAVGASHHESSEEEAG